MHFSYTPKGVCSRKIDLELENGVVTALSFTGGCHGNLQGISALVVGRPAQEVIATLEGINCNGKGTSCPHQLPPALRAALALQYDPIVQAKSGTVPREPSRCPCPLSRAGERQKTFGRNS